MITPADFETWLSYHPPMGFAERGHNEFYFRSRCGRWISRKGNFGTMILKDQERNVIHVVKGSMEDVCKMIETVLSVHPREYSNE